MSGDVIAFPKSPAGSLPASGRRADPPSGAPTGPAALPPDPFVFHSLAFGAALGLGLSVAGISAIVALKAIGGAACAFAAAAAFGGACAGMAAGAVAAEIAERDR